LRETGQKEKATFKMSGGNEISKTSGKGGLRGREWAVTTALVRAGTKKKARFSGIPERTFNKLHSGKCQLALRAPSRSPLRPCIMTTVLEKRSTPQERKRKERGAAPASSKAGTNFGVGRNVRTSRKKSAVQVSVRRKGNISPRNYLID